MLKVPDKDNEEYDWVFIYWYFEHGGHNVWTNYRHPIIPSIASLRHFLPNVKIEVVDVSKKETNWGDYPDHFNFNVRKKDFFLSKFDKPNNKYIGCYSTELLSKNEDCYVVAEELRQERVLVLDADIFWLKSPFPLCGSNKWGFWVNAGSSVNSGLYYYKKGSEDFLRLWRGLNLLAYHDEKLCELALQKCPHHIIEERILNYSLINFKNDTVKIYNKNENFPYSQNCKLDGVKALHFFNGRSPNGMTLESVKEVPEVMEIMKTMFSDVQFKEIFHT